MSPLVVDTTGNGLTYRVIGAAMAVQDQIGAGFKEEVYEKALEVELNRLGIAVQRQVPVPVEFQGEQVAVFYMDLYVEDRVVMEVKALSHQLTNDELGPVINYLKATRASLALLFNFGRRKLEYKRIFHEYVHEYTNFPPKRPLLQAALWRNTFYSCIRDLYSWMVMPLAKSEIIYVNS